MRLDRVYIDGFKNLKGFEIDFDEEQLTAVIIGQNGSGKSNLIEAIATVFHDVDLNRKTRFTYEVDYWLNGRKIRLSNRQGRASIFTVDKTSDWSDATTLSRKEFETGKDNYFPALVFGYYSGTSRRLEAIFDDHQKRYYDKIKREDELDACTLAERERRMFYCRTIHGSFALLALQAKTELQHVDVADFLQDKLGITGFHSALAVLKQPSWFDPSKEGRGRRSFSTLEKQAEALWGALGPAGKFVRSLKENSFLPIAFQADEIDDYRKNARKESQYACFIRDGHALINLAEPYDDRELFTALEAVDISDLIRRFEVWVSRGDDKSGDVGFSDLSEGERQLLMVLGLIRICRGRDALFLLDEPDTHLNPIWQHTYLDLISEWAGLASDAQNLHIVLTSHNPLTIAALEKRQVRILSRDDEGKTTSAEPYVDPRGMGFTATLTEIFGLPTTLDTGTQELVDQRNVLARIDKRTEAQDANLLQITDKLNRLGFMLEDREPLYQDFLRAWSDVKYANRPPMTPEQADLRARAMRNLITELTSDKSKH
ncbi:ATP-binding protein [Mesorhizobium sp. M0522]|uniref:AAA family ATPase n=1 Tax=Mesorhizobium sp. M0522 TaxID=2956958 RepID=UPI003338DE58